MDLDTWAILVAIGLHMTCMVRCCRTMDRHAVELGGLLLRHEYDREQEVRDG